MKKLSQWIDRFAYEHPRFGIENLMRVIVIGNAAVFFLMLFADPGTLGFLAFDLHHLLRGQVWRIVTFVLLPTTGQPFVLLIMLSFYYFVGTALERAWGTAKFNLYYLSAMLLSVLGMTVLSLVTGSHGLILSGAHYINLTLFMAFALLYPDAQLMLYFVIPLKAKWLAALDALLFLGSIAQSLRLRDWPGAVAAIAAIVNFLLFFWGDILSLLHIQSPRRSRQTLAFKAAVRRQQRTETERGYRHKCEICGRTDTEYPNLTFRYCSKCQGYHCFCSEHIFDHQHFT